MLPLSYSAVKWLKCTLMLYPQKQDPEGQLQTFIFCKALLMSGGGGYTVGCIVCCRIQNNLCKVASMDLLWREALESSPMSSKICKLLLRKTNKKKTSHQTEKKESQRHKNYHKQRRVAKQPKRDSNDYKGTLNNRRETLHKLKYRNVVCTYWSVSIPQKTSVLSAPGRKASVTRAPHFTASSQSSCARYSIG